MRLKKLAEMRWVIKIQFVGYFFGQHSCLEQSARFKDQLLVNYCAGRKPGAGVNDLIELLLCDRKRLGIVLHFLDSSKIVLEQPAEAGVDPLVLRHVNGM